MLRKSPPEISMPMRGRVTVPGEHRATKWEGVSRLA
jgi:hypothetical protein